ncbi:MAG TPA: hypothetical protein VF815_38655, partial [Myxococcaceae bacterium]
MSPIGPTAMSSEQAAFLHALNATDRQAFNRYVAERGGAQDVEHKEAFKSEFNRLPLLADESLRRLAHRALAASVGPRVSHTTWTEWPSIEHTWRGTRRTAFWEDYGRRHMEWVQLLAAKGVGPVYNPTSNATGYRNNASTLEMHALHLDADGVGDWHVLFALLVERGIAFLAHRSGGNAPALPKWRIVLPLTRPFHTAAETGVLAWRTTYAVARVTFGALAQLTGPGFDPATDGPHHPWFPGARRRPADPLREVFQNHGATLDLHALLDHLPRPPAPQSRAQSHQTRRTSSPSLLQLAFEAAGM